MNADAAQQCLDISRRAWSERRDLGKALKFARKAEQLHSTAAGRRWLAELSSLSSSADADGADVGGQSAGSRADRTAAGRMKPEPAKNDNTAGGSSNSSIGREYTGEQAEAVRRIKKCGRDYYAVLGLARGCSDADIKKAYRKVPRSLAFCRRWLIVLKIYCCS